MAEDTASPQQQVSIAKYFVMSSPTGEVQEIVKDVRNLCQPAVLTEEKVRGFMREYNTSHMTFAPAPNGENVLVSTIGQISPDTYLDPATGKVLKFDHLKQEFVAETDQKQVLSEAIDVYRVALQEAAKQYVEHYYKQQKVAFAVYGTDAGIIHVCFSAKNVRLTSFWTGGMRSSYKIDISKKGQTELSGYLKINVHYFEDGNVQLNTDVNKAAHVEIADPAATAKTIIAAIEKIESDFQNNLGELYVSMHSETFKAMRRFLPISGQPMQWDVNVHGLASQVNK